MMTKGRTCWPFVGGIPGIPPNPGLMKTLLLGVFVLLRRLLYALQASELHRCDEVACEPQRGGDMSAQDEATKSRSPGCGAADHDGRARRVDTKQSVPRPPTAVYFGLGKPPLGWIPYSSTDDGCATEPRAAQHSLNSCCSALG